MAWQKIVDPNWASHQCALPDPQRVGPGSIWKCDYRDCSKAWKVRVVQGTTVQVRVGLFAREDRPLHEWRETPWPPPPPKAWTEKKYGES